MMVYGGLSRLIKIIIGFTSLPHQHTSTDLTTKSWNLVDKTVEFNHQAQEPNLQKWRLKHQPEMQIMYKDGFQKN